MFLFNCSVGAVHSIGAIGGPLSLSNVLDEVNACHNATLLACIDNSKLVPVQYSGKPSQVVTFVKLTQKRRDRS